MEDKNEQVRKGIIEYYFTQLWEDSSEGLIREIQSHCSTRDPEWEKAKVGAQAKTLIEELTPKVDALLSRWFFTAMAGDPDQLLRFEQVLLDAIGGSMISPELRDAVSKLEALLRGGM